MNDPIVILGARIDALTANYVNSAAGQLMATISPWALSIVTIWVLTYGYAVLRAEVRESLPTFAWRVVRIGLVLGLALSLGVYQQNVVNVATDLQLQLASVFLPAGFAAPSASNVWQLIGQFDGSLEDAILGMIKFGALGPMVAGLLGAVLMSIGACVFEICAVLVVCFAKVMLAFVLAVGPLFILGLLFRPTARFFDAWLSKLLNAIVLSWISFFLLGFCLSVAQALGQVIASHIDSVNYVSVGLGSVIVLVAMGIIQLQAPSWSAALTGGAAVSSGLASARQVLGYSSLATSTPWSRGAESSTAGGSIARGLPASHRMGRAAAQAGSAAGEHVGAAGRVVRRAAYQLAALRGRR
jgi:type IV secretion system protein VirB6